MLDHASAEEASAPAKLPQQLSCPGPLGTPHRLPPYDFYTNSVVRENSDLESKALYPKTANSCVVNEHQDSQPYKVTHIQWFIPEMDGWLFAEQSLPVSRLLERDAEPVKKGAEPSAYFRQIDGCLEYGNQGLTTTAPLFGDIKAEKKSHEPDKGCSQTAVEINQGIMDSIKRKIFTFAQPIVNNFPSFSKEPSDTMLHLEGTAGVKLAGGDSYISYFIFTLSPLGPKGDVKLVTISPDFSGPAKDLLPFFKSPVELTSEGDKLKGTINFQVSDVKDPRLFYTKYKFFDQDKVAVAPSRFPFLYRVLGNKSMADPKDNKSNDDPIGRKLAHLSQGLSSFSLVNYIAPFEQNWFVVQNTRLRQAGQVRRLG